MSKHKNPKKTSPSKKLKKQITFKQILRIIITPIVTAIIADVMIVFSSGIRNVILGDLPNQVDKLDEADNIQKTDIKELETELENLQKEFATLSGNMDIIKGALFTKCDLSGSSLSTKPVTTINDNMETGAGPGWTSDDIVDSDSISG